MNGSTAARVGIAGAVAAAGLAVGGIAIASAAPESPTLDTSAAAPAHPGGPRGDGGRLAEKLAEELGLDQDEVADALEAVRDELRPEKPEDGTRPEPPTDEERAERRAALATALAEELGIAEAKVAAALDELAEQAEADRDERRAEAREDLVSRLDDAVEDGTLTSSDKASVLKAWDAELIGGGFRGGFGGGFGGPRGPAHTS